MIKLTEDEIARIRSAYRSAKGIVDHEFEQAVIDACEPKVQATIDAIIRGETTFEAVDAELLEQWKQLHDFKMY